MERNANFESKVHHAAARVPNRELWGSVLTQRLLSLFFIFAAVSLITSVMTGWLRPVPIVLSYDPAVVAAQVALRAESVVPGLDIRTGARRCSLNDYLQGSWVPRNAMEASAATRGYGYCQTDKRQACMQSFNLRWQPRDPSCPLPAFNANRVKQCLRGKNVIFLGDSLARNQQQSLQCLLMDVPEGPRTYR